MCSWCWGFRPVFDDLCRRLPPEIELVRLLGGLAPDSDQPMPEALCEQLQATWRRIQGKRPETRFNFEFWSRNTPRRSTYPACRAVIAARALLPESEEHMILAIQQAYYLQARNPSDDATLIELAGKIRLDPGAFASRLADSATQHTLKAEIARTRAMGVDSFPSLVLQNGESRWPIPVDYHAADSMLETLRLILT